MESTKFFSVSLHCSASATDGIDFHEESVQVGESHEDVFPIDVGTIFACERALEKRERKSRIVLRDRTYFVASHGIGRIRIGCESL